MIVVANPVHRLRFHPTRVNFQVRRVNETKPPLLLITNAASGKMPWSFSLRRLGADCCRGKRRCHTKKAVSESRETDQRADEQVFAVFYLIDLEWLFR